MLCFSISQTISAIITEPALVCEALGAASTEEQYETEYQWKRYYIQSNGLINDMNQITVGLLQ